MQDRFSSKLLIALMVVFAIALIVCVAVLYQMVSQSGQNPEQLHNQALGSLQRKDYAGAEKFFQQAIEESKNSSDKVKYPALLCELANMYRTQNKLALAQETFQKAIAEYKEVIRSNATDTSSQAEGVRQECAIQMGNLADVLRDQGKLDDAQRLYKEAIAQGTSATGVVTVLERLQRDYAQCLRKMGRIKDAEAIELQLEAISITALSWNDYFNNAVAQFRKGSFNDADKMFAVAQLVAERLSSSWKSSETQFWLAVSSLSKGNVAIAQDELKRAIELMSASKEEKDHKDIAADPWAYMAYSQYLNGQSKEAALSYRKAVQLFPNVAEHFEYLGTAYAQLGKLDAQHRLYRWMLDQETKDSRKVGILHQLATGYFAQSKYVEAEPLYEWTLRILETNKRSDSNEAAVVDHELAVCYFYTHRYSEAEPLFRRAVAINEKLGNSNSVETATVLDQLGGNYACMNQYAKADAVFERALVVYEKVEGVKSLALARVSRQLAEAYDAQGRYADADPLYRRALAILEKSKEASSFETACCLSEFGANSLSEKRYSEAEAAVKQALPILEKEKGSNSMEVADNLALLADDYNEQRKYAQAEPLYQRALAICQKLKELNVGRLSKAFNALADNYRSQGKYLAALPLNEQGLATAIKQYGPTSLGAMWTLNGIAEDYHGAGKYAEAEASNRQALAICEKHKDAGEGEFYTLETLATNCRYQKKYTEAEKFYKRALLIIEKLKGPTSPEATRVRGELQHLR